jgi:hypothetical protein
MDKTVALLLTPEEIGVILSSLIGTSQSMPDAELAPELVSALSKVTKVYSELRLQARAS